MILLVDNYDSFTWNLYHYLDKLTSVKIVVKRNDEVTSDEAGNFDGILFSPGPGLPSEAGNMMQIIHEYSSTIPMLGICLGHQALAEAYGASLYNLEKVLHGKSRTTLVKDNSDPLFRGFPSSFQTGHYHSWMVSTVNLPVHLKVTATDEDGEIMAITHDKFPFSGVQFHPESVLTSKGSEILSNWLQHHGLK